MKVDRKAIHFVSEFQHVNKNNSGSIGNDYNTVQPRHSLQYQKPTSDKSFKSLVSFFFTNLTVRQAHTKLHGDTHTLTFIETRTQ